MNLEQVCDKLKAVKEKITIMEVCGTHTASIFRSGIRELISPSIRLVSGPGCPVCVTSAAVIDELVSYAMKDNCTVLSFGDMFRVRGSQYSLSDAKAMGGNVQLMYSPFEVTDLAGKHKDTLYIVAAVGFETTVPIYAALLELLIQNEIENVKFCMSLKNMPPILDYVCQHEAIDGFLCPGHVSVVIGSNAYEDLLEKYRKPFVIAGFGVEHILTAVYEIVRQLETGEYGIRNLYPSVVKEAGQTKALGLIERYFEKSDAVWRGIGKIEQSGYTLKDEFRRYLLEGKETEQEQMESGCRCSEVILGRISPAECPLFGKVCHPSNPVGACMVSAEGTCRIWNENSVR